MQYIILIIGILFFSSIVGNVYLLKQNTTLKYQAKINNAIVDSQNKAIESMALDTQSYTCSMDTLEAYTKSKYEKAISEHENETCESKLQSLEKALNIFESE